MRSGGRDGPVERVGKKYQWIGLYEVLGRIADHHKVKRSRVEDQRPYEYAEQLVWRDIDPTVLVRKPRDRKVRWGVRGSPQPAPHREVVDDYPTDTAAGVPIRLDPIAGL